MSRAYANSVGRPTIADTTRITMDTEDSKIVYVCDHCKARAGAKDYNRFAKRHGVNCKKAERTAFTKQLAAGTRSVDADGWLDD